MENEKDVKNLFAKMSTALSRIGDSEKVIKTTLEVLNMEVLTSDIKKTDLEESYKGKNLQIELRQQTQSEELDIWKTMLQHQHEENMLKLKIISEVKEVKTGRGRSEWEDMFHCTL